MSKATFLVKDALGDGAFPDDGQELYIHPGEYVSYGPVDASFGLVGERFDYEWLLLLGGCTWLLIESRHSLTFAGHEQPSAGRRGGIQGVYHKLDERGAVRWLLVNGFDLPRELRPVAEPLSLLKRLLGQEPATAPGAVVGGAETRQAVTLADEDGPPPSLDQWQTPATQPRCSVMLRGCDKGPLVFGKEMPVVPDAPTYAALEALNRAFRKSPGQGFGNSELDDESGVSEARKKLAALRESSDAWCRAIKPANEGPGRPKAGSGGWQFAPDPS